MQKDEGKWSFYGTWKVLQLKSEGQLQLKSREG